MARIYRMACFASHKWPPRPSVTTLISTLAKAPCLITSTLAQIQKITNELNLWVNRVDSSKSSSSNYHHRRSWPLPPFIILFRVRHNTRTTITLLINILLHLPTRHLFAMDLIFKAAFTTVTRGQGHLAPILAGVRLRIFRRWIIRKLKNNIHHVQL